MKTLTPAMLLKALKMFRGFTKAAGEYLRDKERLRYLLAAAVLIAQGRGGKLLKDLAESWVLRGSAEFWVLSPECSDGCAVYLNMS